MLAFKSNIIIESLFLTLKPTATENNLSYRSIYFYYMQKLTNFNIAPMGANNLIIIEDLFPNAFLYLCNFQIQSLNRLNWGRNQSQICEADSGWLHQRPPQTIQSQYCITMLRPTNNNSAYFLFQQVLWLDITHFTLHFIWLYHDGKELRQYLSAQKSITQMNKNKLIFCGFKFKVSGFWVQGLFYMRNRVVVSWFEPPCLLLANPSRTH